MFLLEQNHMTEYISDISFYLAISPLRVMVAFSHMMLEVAQYFSDSLAMTAVASV